MRIAVVGGGIAGLSAAWELRGQADVTVFEPDQLGGKIRTSAFAGGTVDEGPDAFLTRVPSAVELCRELGLDGDLVAPRAGRTMIWTDGRLRVLPAGLVLGVPKNLGPVARSRLLTPTGILRAALDLVLPRSPVDSDLSVDELISRRFGPEVAARLVEPLLGSIHAARTADLSVEATAPNLLAAARASRSLLLALRRQPIAPSSEAMFLAPRAGMSALVDALVAQLRLAGVAFVTHSAESVRTAGRQVTVDGEVFGGALLAVPAPQGAGLLGHEAPAGLSSLPLTDVVLVTLEVDGSSVTVPTDINGILVPPGEGSLLTASSFGSHKWPQWPRPNGHFIIRASAGRNGDDRCARLDDSEVVDQLTAEIGRALGREQNVVSARVSRWPRSFPLYRVGHLERMGAAEAQLERDHPRIGLCGSSYRGAGLPACITSGRTSARRLLARLGTL